jgi:hypothetical protein
MAAVSRSFSIQYGSVTIGGAGAYILQGDIVYARRYDRLDISFLAIATGATLSAFNTACSTIEAEFRKPRQTLIVTIRNTAETFTHAQNTGMNADPRIEHDTGNRANGRLSRVYRCSVSVDLPADLAAANNSGEAGLSFASIEYITLPTEQRSVTIAGSYTALASASAKAQFEAQISDYASNVLQAIDPSLDDEDDWDLQPEEHEIDWQNKVCRFRRTYIERIFDDSDDEPRESGFRNVRQAAIVRREYPQGADGVLTEQPIVVQVFYSVEVVKSLYPQLEDAWNLVIRQRVKSLAEQAAGSSQAAQFIDGTPSYDYTSWRISVNATLVVYGTVQVLFSEYRERIQQKAAFGLVSVNSDNPHAKLAMPEEAVAVKTVEVSLFLIGDKAEARGIVLGMGLDVDASYIPDTIEGLPAFSQDTPYDLTNLPGFGAQGGGWVRQPPSEDFQPIRRLGDSISGDVPVIFSAYSVSVDYVYAVPVNTGTIAPVPTAPAFGVGGGPAAGGAIPLGGGDDGGLL